MNTKQSDTKPLIFFALVAVFCSGITLQDIHQKVVESAQASTTVLSSASTNTPGTFPSRGGTAIIRVDGHHTLLYLE